MTHGIATIKFAYTLLLLIVAYFLYKSDRTFIVTDGSDCVDDYIILDNIYTTPDKFSDVTTPYTTIRLKENFHLSHLKHTLVSCVEATWSCVQRGSKKIQIYNACFETMDKTFDFCIVEKDQDHCNPEPYNFTFYDDLTSDSLLGTMVEFPKTIPAHIGIEHIEDIHPEKYKNDFKTLKEKVTMARKCFREVSIHKYVLSFVLISVSLLHFLSEWMVHLQINRSKSRNNELSANLRLLSIKIRDLIGTIPANRGAINDEIDVIDNRIQNIITNN